MTLNCWFSDIKQKSILHFVNSSTALNLTHKNTHRNKALLHKTQALTKSMKMSICVISSLNQVFIRNSSNWIKFLKNKVVSGKTLFFAIVPFWIVQYISLDFGSSQKDLYGNNTFSVIILSTQKHLASFLIKVLIFQICFKVKVMKMFKPLVIHISFS